MAEHQSADASLFSRETDEEKSLESNDDMCSMIADMNQDLEDNNNNNNNNNKNDNSNSNDNDNDNDNSDNEIGADNLSRVRRSSRNNGGYTGNKKSDDEAEDDDDVNETNNNKRNNDDDDETNKESKKIKKNPTRKNLNQPTLEAMEKYLKSGKFFDGTLEYEEVAAFASKIHRYTVERTRLRRGLLFQEGGIENGDDHNVDINPIIISKEDAADELLYNQVYQREEFYAVAAEFSKTMVDGAHDMAGSNFISHAQTVNWLKRAAGMQRQYDPYDQSTTRGRQKFTRHHSQQLQAGYSDESEDGGEGETTVGAVVDGGGDGPRRLTRRRVRMTRKKRRQERVEKETENFRILADVVGDLEKHSDVLGERSKKGIKRGPGDGSPLPIDGIAVEGDCDTKDDDDVEMMDSIPETPKPFPSLISTGLTQIGSNNKTYQYNRSSTIAALTTYIDSDQRNQKDDATMMTEEEKEEAPSQYFVSEEISLPPSIAMLGLEFRPQSLKLEEASNSHRYLQKGNKDADGTPKGNNYSDDLYVKNCKILMNTLSNKHARNWAAHEFFYSDMDREWYQNDGFISDLAKLGLPISSKTRFTKREWSIVRRKLRLRPRLFSKRFIADQIKKRNRHRSLIRQLQQDPEIIEFRSIPLGTVVTAYHKRGSTIRQGRVLLHDPNNHNYLIQFDDEEFGCEVCPDSEVAISASTSSSNGSDPKPAPPPLYDSCNLLSFEKNVDIKEVVLSKGATSSGRTESIEREILISLLAAIKEGFERKKKILQALDCCSEIPSGCSSKHVSWLLANLDRSNSTLQAALTHLQVLYGVSYQTEASKEDAKVERMRLRKDFPDNKLCQELVTSLTSISEKVGELIFPNIDVGDRNQKKESSSRKLRKDLSGSANLLLLVNYLTESLSLESNKATFSGAMDAVLKSSLDKYANICLPPTSETLLIGQKLKDECQLENELKDLADAVGMLRAEVSIAADEKRTFEHALSMGNN